jgi:hypothetical protein
MTKIVTVALEKPIGEGEAAIKTVNVRKPGAGEMRGLAIPKLITGDVSSYITLIPRITSPIISEEQVSDGDQLDAADLTMIMNEVMNFLLPQSMKQSLPSLLTS